jgi:chemotaxis protein CheZ
MAFADLPVRNETLLARLNSAYATGDEAGFEQALDELLAGRTSVALTDMQRLSHCLFTAITRFRTESRIATLAAREVPDAQLRLDHVLQMTEDATHRTLHIIEQTAPVADATARGASKLADTLEGRTHDEIRQFLGEVRSNAELVRHNLTEVMLAQGFQDLTGQILRGVRSLVGEIESVLQELATTAGVNLELAAPDDTTDISPQGPAIPGLSHNAINNQGDVDDLIAGLGI